MTSRLNYHRCHGERCEAGHPAKTFTSQPEERRRGWKPCKCPIQASGSLTRKFKRMATKQTDWEKAEALMAPYLIAGTWDLDHLPKASQREAPAEDDDNPKKRGLMADAAAAYLAEHRAAESAEHTTVYDHQCRLRRALLFCQRKGIVKVSQWTEDLAREFLGLSKVSPSSAETYRKKLKAFFAWCIHNKWTDLKENPAAYQRGSIHNVKTKSISAGKQKFPFTDEQLREMYAACEICDDFSVDRKKKVVPLRKGTRKFTGQDMAHFIALSSFTGLRIIDVSKFHIDRLQGEDQIHVRTLKADTMVYTAVPLWLAQIIRERAAKFGPYIFGEHTSTSPKVITAQWRDRLNKVWQLCETPFATKPTPHRFRHTFARILLQKGESPATVAQLLGNTEAVVNVYYSSWVKERQDRITALMREAFQDVPNPITARKKGKVQSIA